MINKAQTRKDFYKTYTGDPSFREEAYQWFLLGRIDGMMENLRIAEKRKGKIE